MAFEPYDAGKLREGELTGIVSAFSLRQEGGLVCVLEGKDGVVHVSFNSSSEPGFYSQFIVHVTQTDIKAEGSKGEFDKQGVFTGRRHPIDTAVLGEFDPSELPSSVQQLYTQAVNYGIINPTSSAQR